MDQQLRQGLMSTLARASASELHSLWQQLDDGREFEFLRKPETGMVMAVGRAGGEGEPFNIGEVSVSRCAIRLSSGETGLGYVKGRNTDHALYMALIDALAQHPDHETEVMQTVVKPLQRKQQAHSQQQQHQAQKTQVEFFTMVRGESE